MTMLGRNLIWTTEVTAGHLIVRANIISSERNVLTTSTGGLLRTLHCEDFENVQICKAYNAQGFLIRVPPPLIGSVVA